MQQTFLDEIGPQIKIANTLIEKELNSRVASLISEYPLTGPQITLMVYLYESKGRTITQKEVADKFVLSHPTIRSIVKRLANHGLIDVGYLETDHRQVTLSLSNKGFQLLEKHIDDIRQTMTDVNKQTVSQLSDTDIKQLQQYLSTIIHHF
ncbi:MAG TPA: MarR family transcriptional regulator [Weissella thailandensis]|uniref:MarR family winged helix-turn-helix transcriptional regulator n=1 Tax=Weissella thailandensis TaxID=89061 RepID=UPI001DCC81AA|nr:MarR family transcriptional regulator [Weissella thailandensis]HJG85398.1 MarR family transcriptional regulator [Weissella thailandensis]